MTKEYTNADGKPSTRYSSDEKYRIKNKEACKRWYAENGKLNRQQKRLEAKIEKSIEFLYEHGYTLVKNA